MHIKQQAATIYCALGSFKSTVR